jgi:mannose-6-phosphate isomerase
MENIYPLQGTIMQYDWGGPQFLPELLGIPNKDGKPFAEYWMGAHPKSSSTVLISNQPEILIDAIANNPTHFLGQRVADLFGRLPFLLKVQDVQHILSIQVHPTLEEAIAGFDREEKAGIPIDAPHRNYKDKNHKPEMLVTLSDFWLLHGFCSPELITQRLEEIPEFNLLKPLFNKEGLKAVYQFVMEMNSEDAHFWLLNLVKREIRKKREQQLTKQDPGWWVARLFPEGEEPSNIDKAIFSIYILNIVHLPKGASLFQSAGLPHAYMEGQCVELMSNSDNVLRAGLTPKHIDVPELIRLTRFETTIPSIQTGIVGVTGETQFPVPIKDFALTRLEITPQISYQHKSSSPEIIVVTESAALFNQEMVVKRGESVYILPNTDYQITSSGAVTLFRAWVP